MNSEELELSLRTEFENYLKAVVADIRKETSEFQSKIEAEFDRHKNQFDEELAAFSARFESDREVDVAFASSVGEHLRLARDEGAKIAATAMVEAEKLDRPGAGASAEPVAPPVYDALRDAVIDISSKDSQSAILKSLVEQAAAFAPRGAFFIVKNEHFVGWKVFGADEAADSAVREVHFPTTSKSILGVAASTLATAEGSAGAYGDDSAFLDPIQFGQPDRMYAIPLTARGRAVAVLYADYGQDGTALNREALEMLVRVAGLTVELHAAGQSAQGGAQPATELEDTQHDTEAYTLSQSSPFVENIPEAPVQESGGFSFSETVSYDGGAAQEIEAPTTMEAESTTEAAFAQFDEAPDSESTPAETFEYQSFETVETAMEVETFDEPSSDFESPRETEPAFQFGSDQGSASAIFGSSPFDTSAEEYAPAGMPSGGFEPAVEPVVEAPAPLPAVPKARLSDRPVDLPIEVPEGERRSHNDARRFARLLVSEIKLYNEKKVVEGREASDLYDRLREAIDRSREMYDKRVQPPVASKFDYFHYELVNSLAEGDDGRLGNGYPGASV